MGHISVWKQSAVSNASVVTYLCVGKVHKIIYSWIPRPFKIKALCFFEMLGTTDPVAQCFFEMLGTADPVAQCHVPLCNMTV